MLLSSAARAASKVEAASQKYNVSFDYPDYNLHSAASNGDIGLAHFALRSGQPANSVLEGLLPIHLAAASGSDAIVETLIQAGADVNAPRLPLRLGGCDKGKTLGLAVGQDGSTALHFAAANGHIDVIRRLLRNGADASREDCTGVRPETVAADGGHKEIADLLRTSADFPPPQQQQQQQQHQQASSYSPVSPKASIVFPSPSRSRMLKMQQSFDSLWSSRRPSLTNTSNPPSSVEYDEGSSSSPVKLLAAPAPTAASSSALPASNKAVQDLQSSESSSSSLWAAGPSRRPSLPVLAEHTKRRGHWMTHRSRPSSAGDGAESRLRKLAALGPSSKSTSTLPAASSDDPDGAARDGSRAGLPTLFPVPTASSSSADPSTNHPPLPPRSTHVPLTRSRSSVSISSSKPVNRATATSSSARTRKSSESNASFSTTNNHHNANDAHDSNSNSIIITRNGGPEYEFGRRPLGGGARPSPSLSSSASFSSSMMTTRSTSTSSSLKRPSYPALHQYRSTTTTAAGGTDGHKGSPVAPRQPPVKTLAPSPRPRDFGGGSNGGGGGGARGKLAPAASWPSSVVPEQYGASRSAHGLGVETDAKETTRDPDEDGGGNVHHLHHRSSRIHRLRSGSIPPASEESSFAARPPSSNGGAGGGGSSRGAEKYARGTYSSTSSLSSTNDERASVGEIEITAVPTPLPLFSSHVNTRHVFDRSADALPSSALLGASREPRLRGDSASSTSEPYSTHGNDSLFTNATSTTSLTHSLSGSPQSSIHKRIDRSPSNATIPTLKLETASAHAEALSLVERTRQMVLQTTPSAGVAGLTGGGGGNGSLAEALERYGHSLELEREIAMNNLRASSKMPSPVGTVSSFTVSPVDTPVTSPQRIVRKVPSVPDPLASRKPRHYASHGTLSGHRSSSAATLPRGHGSRVRNLSIAGSTHPRLDEAKALRALLRRNSIEEDGAGADGSDLITARMADDSESIASATLVPSIRTRVSTRNMKTPLQFDDFVDDEDEDEDQMGISVDEEASKPPEKPVDPWRFLSESPVYESPLANANQPRPPPRTERPVISSAYDPNESAFPRKVPIVAPPPPKRMVHHVRSFDDGFSDVLRTRIPPPLPIPSQIAVAMSGSGKVLGSMRSAAPTGLVPSPTDHGAGGPKAKLRNLVQTFTGKQ